MKKNFCEKLYSPVHIKADSESLDNFMLGTPTLNKEESFNAKGILLKVRYTNVY